MAGVSRQRPFRAHAERQGRKPERFGDRAADFDVARELVGRLVRRFERSAGKLELPAGLERDRRSRRPVVEADEAAAVLDPLPAEADVHAFEQRADPPLAFVRDGRGIGAVEQDLLVLRTDAERRVALASGLEPARERVTRFDDFPVDDVASHAG